ncbi:MAG: RNA polymerase sigma factor [Myxococcota bacterium]
MAGELRKPAGKDPGPELLERWRAGDPTAFTAIFRSYRGLVWRVLHRLLRGDPELEDVVQLVFIEVHRSLDRFEGRARLSSWITRVALNVGYHHLRRKKSRPADYRAEYRDVDAPDERPGVDPEAGARGREAAARVHEVLAQLPEKKRTVFLLVDLEGLTHDQVAEIVGASAATVRTRLFYARKEFWKRAAADPVLAELV